MIRCFRRLDPEAETLIQLPQCFPCAPLDLPLGQLSDAKTKEYT